MVRGGTGGVRFKGLDVNLTRSNPIENCGGRLFVRGKGSRYIIYITS